MFAGIIEEVGTVIKIEKEKNNAHLYIQSSLTEEVKIDQSIAHNGVCLTVIDIIPEEHIHVVTAIKETLDKSNLGTLEVNSRVNLERCITPETRIDGHYVQGHVDTTTQCLEVVEVGGSWYYTFALPTAYRELIVDKGSISINGVSLTVVDPADNTFKVAIIPYTYENTVFKHLAKGDMVNLEFDILGKYVARHLQYLEK